jgi:hypothetical protein
VERQFLHSDSSLIRKLSCIAYCAATLVAAVFWAAAAPIDDPSPVRWVGAAIGAVPVWWVVAGLGLRLVRMVERLERRSSHRTVLDQ